MTDTPNLRKLISLAYLDLISGDVHARHQFISPCMTHMSIFLRTEMIEPNLSPIAKFRTRLHQTVSMILHNNHPLPAWDTKREPEIKILENYFDRFVIKIDEKVADEKGIEQIEALADMETLEYCRNIAYSAAQDYSLALAGNPEGLSMASNKYSYILDKIIPIMFTYRILDISEADYANAARSAAARIESEREKMEGKK
jgi:hypothetical protein